MVAEPAEATERLKKVREQLAPPTVIRDAAEAMRILEDEEWIGLDLETNGLSPWRNDIAVITLHGEKTNTAAVLHVRGRLPRAEYDTLRAWLGSTKRTYTTHNGVCFDIPFLANAGVNVFGPTWFDTMVGEAVTMKVSRRDLSKSLKDTLHRRLKKEIDKKQQVSVWMAPVLSDEQVEYCIGDVQYLPKLRRTHYELVSEDARAEAMEVEAAIIPAVLHMHHNGMPLNLTKVDEYLAEQAVKSREAREELFVLLGRSDINLNSYVKVRDTINAQGYGPKLKSTNAETLGILAEQNQGKLGDFARSMLVYRRATKRESMFSEEWRAANAFDHRTYGHQGVYFPVPHDIPNIHWVHSRFRQLGTETGRFSSSEPNGQQIPKDARCLFGGIPGYKVVSCDYSQLEIRGAANIFDDAALIAAFEAEEAGGDIHTMIASQIFGKPPEEITKEERKVSKAASFTLLFGGSAGTLYEYAMLSGSTITEEQAWEVYRAFFRRFQGLERAKNWAKATAYRGIPVPIDMPYGLRRMLTGLDLRPTVMLNSMVQGTAASGLKFALLKCVERKLDTYLCATVHDELVGVVPDYLAEEWGHDLEQAMIDGMRMVLRRVPIRAELAIGDFWS